LQNHQHNPILYITPSFKAKLLVILSIYVNYVPQIINIVSENKTIFHFLKTVLTYSFESNNPDFFEDSIQLPLQLNFHQTFRTTN